MKVIYNPSPKYVTNHAVGEVYLCNGRFYMLCISETIFDGDDLFFFVDIESGKTSETYHSLSTLDLANPEDVLVNVDLVVRE